MKLLVIDGNSILNRAFYGISLLSSKSGEYTNAVYGFINILFKLLQTENPDGVAVAFDLKKPTFRHLKYEGYKAGRKPMPEELHSQLPLMREWLTLAGYHVVEKEGYEADDILGTLAAAAEQTGNDCVLATGDRDSFQLIGEHTKVLLSTTRSGHPEVVCYDKQALFDRYGMTPDQMIDLKALMGDPSDKIPGVPGIGEKTATELIHTYGSLENLYNHLDDKALRPAVKTKLQAGKDSAELSRFLGTICRNVPIDTDLEHYRYTGRDDEGLARLMTRLELFRQMETMRLSPAHDPATPTKEVPVQSLHLTSPAAFVPQGAVCLFADESAGVMGACDGQSATQYAFGDDLSALATLLDSEIPKEVYDSKRLYRFCADRNLCVKAVVFDTILAAYLTNPSATQYDLPTLCKAYYIADPVTDAPLPDAAANAARMVTLNRKLTDELSGKDQMSLFTDIELPLAEVLADMERCGVKAEVSSITEMGQELAERLDSLKRQITDMVGYDFNLNSPKQLGEALFEHLGLPAKKKAGGGYSTSAEILEGLRQVHPVIDLLLSYRQLSKLKSTYCDALADCIATDGRIHTTFNQTETRTGRISSLNPNLQNIPVRSEEGRRLRRFFTAKDGCVLCDADYSQIELRVLAAMAQDEAMIEAFGSGADIHTATASQVFSLPPDMITPALRSRAKAVNFGIVYGIGAFSLSKDIGVTRKEADTYIKNYLSVYHGIASFMDKLISDARQNGYVTTLFGRRRYLPELSSSNHMLRAFGERVARNAPIQGTAADIIKIAMIAVWRRLAKEQPNAKLILQVHDELIVECPKEDQEAVCRILKEEMEAAAHLPVDLSVDVHSGKTWYDAKG